ncbi:MAG: helix-turn-helix transcriptional regulator [Bacteriovorax sp.]|jgi:transcriptional regulator with XRE-family HTH domain
MKSMKAVLKEIDAAELGSGEAVRVIRKSLGLTLKDLAEISGIRETHLSAIENSSYEISKKNAERLGAALGVHPATILFPEGVEKSTELQEIEKRRKKVLSRKVS